MKVAIVSFEPLVFINVYQSGQKKFLQHKPLKIKYLLSQLIQDFESFLGDGVALVDKVINEVADLQSGLSVECGVKLDNVAKQGPDEGGFVFYKEVSVDLLIEGRLKITHEVLQYFKRHKAVPDQARQVYGKLHDLDAVAGPRLYSSHQLIFGVEVKHSFEE